jgi:hypothetical protein
VSAEGAFVALVGAVLTHFTPAANAASIRALGLLPPEALALRAGTRPDDLILCDGPVILRFGNHTAQLNHQIPLRAGRKQEAHFLDGHTLASWAAQLDRRVFFWPATRAEAFASRLATPEALRFDTRMLFRRCGDRLDLSPINSGSALRRAARRGDWLDVPATRASEFPDARRLRGAARARLSVAEVSLRGGLPPDALAACLVP